MIGYVLEQELRSILPATEQLATILTMVEVDPADPAFANPTKFVGPVYTEQQAQRLTEEKGWPFRQDGASWRRVVPSPVPQHIYTIEPIRQLLDRDVLVICAGGGGIPTMRTDDGRLAGVEAVIDKDLASELLARELQAELFLMATDVEGVYAGWGSPDQRLLNKVTPSELRSMDFPPGSMLPKVQAAADFVDRTGGTAAIGRLDQIDGLVAGAAGTQVVPG
jgi:carbamate kinase